MTVMGELIKFGESVARYMPVETPLIIKNNALFDAMSREMKPLLKYSNDNRETDPETGARIWKGEGEPVLCHEIFTHGADIKVYRE